MLGGPVQLAYAVADIDDGVQRWLADGVGPFFVNSHIELVRVRVRGAPGRFDHTSAFAWWGDVMVELIHQHPSSDGPDDADQIVGSSGLHHIAHFVDDFGTAGRWLTESGRAEVLYAETAGGMPFAMHNGSVSRSHLIEIYERTRTLVGFYDMVRSASIGWDGRDPVRVL